jgi:hypothetical protein
MDEQWREIAGFPDYMISDHGRVHSRSRVLPCCKAGSRQRTMPGRLMQGIAHIEKGRLSYLGVRLFVGRKGYNKRIHRLVLDAFFGPCPEGLEGCHNDGNPANNYLSNLRWDTRTANAQDAVRHGRHKTSFPKGEAHPRAKLTDEQVREIRSLYSGAYGQIAALAKQFGVARQSIDMIVRMKMRLAA